MGFDFNLTIETFIDSETGLPFVWSITDVKKIPYNPEEWRLPERFRQFAIMRGHHLGAYTRDLPLPDLSYRADVHTVLAYFPKWVEVAEDMEWAGCDWDAEKHYLFKECLEWCTTKPGYWCTWSY